LRSTPIVRAVNDAVAALTEPEEEPATAAKARELRSTALASRSSLAAQLGLKVRRVVVDAGHGGKDAGAIGPHGVREKNLTLSIAKKVAARLKLLGFTVVMTRSRDTFVSLDDRTRIANEARADLFVSIHCNAARRRNFAGVETWTLNVASDRYAARLAAFENAEADRTVSDLRLILADLATKANAGDARNLAQSVQSSLVRTLRSRVGPVRDHGVKQALFYVLLGTHMPSILVETGFISNPAEEARLKSLRFQEGTAEAIARGVKDFVDARRRLALAP
jgi:N-acetylmuramoyl-L-alanine amidase